MGTSTVRLYNDWVMFVGETEDDRNPNARTTCCHGLNALPLPTMLSLSTVHRGGSLRETGHASVCRPTYR
jgi:hypothetical protein